MTRITAELKNYRQSPRKVRLVADTVRGKKVESALTHLMFTTKRASNPLVKLIKSAIANARHNFNLNPENLIIKEIKVDGGVIMYRRRPRARGSAFPIRKRTSHVNLVLEEKK